MDQKSAEILHVIRQFLIEVTCFYRLEVLPALDGELPLEIEVRRKGNARVRRMARLFRMLDFGGSWVVSIPEPLVPMPPLAVLRILMDSMICLTSQDAATRALAVDNLGLDTYEEEVALAVWMHELELHAPGTQGERGPDAIGSPNATWPTPKSGGAIRLNAWSDLLASVGAA